MSNGNARQHRPVQEAAVRRGERLRPISTLGFFDLGIFVGSGSRFATLADVLKFAKANPGKLTIGTIAVGSTQHLSAELFKTMRRHRCADRALQGLARGADGAACR